MESLQDRAVKAIKEIKQYLSLWLSGQITHESTVETINKIVKKADVK